MVRLADARQGQQKPAPAIYAAIRDQAQLAGDIAKAVALAFSARVSRSGTRGLGAL